MIVPVIIAGGKGLRLWPHSRQAQPKPFVAVTGHERTLLQSTLMRLNCVSDLHAPLVVCNAALGFQVQAQAASAGIVDVSLLLEPEGRNTAPAICAAALMIERLVGADATMLVLPADHMIADETAFARAIAEGADLAGQNFLVTFAMKPTGPATGYGYLKLGSAINESKRQFKLDAFVEKPELKEAREFLADGRYAWNSGMFMFKVAGLLKNFEALQPAILRACKNAMPLQTGSSPFLLDREAFFQAPAISIDHGIMEKAANVATVVAELGWSDVGDWDAVWQASDKDPSGVVARGNVHVMESTDSIVQSDGPLVVGLGLDNMIAIGTRDAILVAPKSRSQDVKKVVDALAALGRGEAKEATRIFKPWGWHEIVRVGPGFRVQEIAVIPGGRRPQECHTSRVSHWICMAGRGAITRGGEHIEFRAGMAFDFPTGVMHGLENPGTGMMHIIEVLVGGDSGDDIGMP